MVDSERQLLNKLPGEVKNIDDIPKVKKQFERKLKKKDMGFFAVLKPYTLKTLLTRKKDQKKYV